MASKLKVTCRFRKGGTVDLDLLDISHGGCMVDRRRHSATAGDRALVKLPGLAFQPATVVWVEDEKAGLAFEQPLHEAVLAHLSQAAEC